MIHEHDAFRLAVHRLTASSMIHVSHGQSHLCTEQDLSQHTKCHMSEHVKEHILSKFAQKSWVRPSASNLAFLVSLSQHKLWLRVSSDCAFVPGSLANFTSSRPLIVRARPQPDKMARLQPNEMCRDRLHCTQLPQVAPEQLSMRFSGPQAQTRWRRALRMVRQSRSALWIHRLQTGTRCAMRQAS